MDADTVIGDRVRAYRKQRGLTLRGLSEVTGLAIETLSRIENGKQKLGYRAAYHISKALDVDFDYIRSA